MVNCSLTFIREAHKPLGEPFIIQNFHSGALFAVACGFGEFAAATWRESTVFTVVILTVAVSLTHRPATCLKPANYNIASKHSLITTKRPTSRFPSICLGLNQ